MNITPATATRQIANISPRTKARFAGVFWLLTILFSGFAGLSGDKFVVAGDAAATASNVLGHEVLFRSAIAANVIATFCYLVVTLLLYVLLKAVNRDLSLLAAFFGLMGCAVSGASFILNFAPLAVLGNPHPLGGLNPEQLQAIALIFLKVNAQAFNVGMTCFGLQVLTVGYLIFNSTFLPRILGVLLAIAGVCYLTNSFANFLALPFKSYLLPFVLASALLGEGSLTFWLLIKGVNAERWNEQSAFAGDGAA